MSSMRLIWLKMSTREPLAFILRSSLSSFFILSELNTRCSSVVKGGRARRRQRDVGEEEVEQRPELHEVVLERRAGDEQAGARVEGTHDLGEHRVDVLDAVRLVNDDVLPRELLERALFAQAHLVGGDEHVKVLGQQVFVDDLVALLLGALEGDHVEAGHPALELAVPVVQRRLGHDDEVEAGRVAEVAEVAEEGDGLERLAEAHLVCEDAVDAVVVERDHPVEALDLGSRAWCRP
ncbi:hypothetical protein L1887_62392 [Cichorium endivia]|nr:hypothetical protein L1887_62392 [Cichorium endivia]